MKIPTTMMTESVPARNAVAGSQSWLPTIVIAMAQIPESPPILRISARLPPRLQVFTFGAVSPDPALPGQMSVTGVLRQVDGGQLTSRVRVILPRSAQLLPWSER